MRVEVRCEQCGDLVRVRWWQSAWTAWARHQETADHLPPLALDILIDGQTTEELEGIAEAYDEEAIRRGLKCGRCGEESRRKMVGHVCQAVPA